MDRSCLNRQLLHAGDTQRVITVRLASALHKALLKASHAAETSLNQLCVDRLTEAARPYLDPAAVSADPPADQPAGTSPRFPAPSGPLASFPPAIAEAATDVGPEPTVGYAA